MEEILAVYAEIIKAAEDGQVVQHLSNLVKDAATVAEAIKNVVDQARARAAQPA